MDCLVTDGGGVLGLKVDFGFSGSPMEAVSIVGRKRPGLPQPSDGGCSSNFSGVLVSRCHSGVCFLEWDSRDCSLFLLDTTLHPNSFDHHLPLFECSFVCRLLFSPISMIFSGSRTSKHHYSPTSLSHPSYSRLQRQSSGTVPHTSVEDSRQL
jgi:hypothetical protein